MSAPLFGSRKPDPISIFLLHQHQVKVIYTDLVAKTHAGNSPTITSTQRMHERRRRIDEAAEYARELQHDETLTRRRRWYEAPTFL